MDSFLIGANDDFSTELKLGEIKALPYGYRCVTVKQVRGVVFNSIQSSCSINCALIFLEGGAKLM